MLASSFVTQYTKMPLSQTIGANPPLVEIAMDGDGVVTFPVFNVPGVTPPTAKQIADAMALPEPGPSVEVLLGLLAEKERLVLANTVFSHALADGSDTLNTKNDDRSILLLNTLSGWALANIAAKPPVTRNYYNLDNSSHTVPAPNIAEFLSANGEFVQRVLDASVAAAGAITAAKPTITTVDQINGYAWPTA